MAIDERVKGVDELCHRWAIQAFDWQSIGVSSTWRAMQAAAGILLEPAFPPDMDKDVTILWKLMTEMQASKDDAWVYLVCYAHYCTGGSGDQKAKRLRIGKTRFYDMLGEALMYIKGRLVSRGLRL